MYVDHALARAAAVVAVLLAACRPGDPRPADEGGAPGPPARPTSSASAKPREPLGGDWLERLPLSGLADARVSVPLGATEPRSIVVALHGKGDRPEWACGEWRGITDAHPFVLCPHGTPIDAPASAGLGFPDATATTREIRAGLAALRSRYGDHVRDDSIVLVGFSLGANRSATIAISEPATFPRVMLVEGGHQAWTPANVQRFADGGGRRVVLGCSTRACEAAARPIAKRFEAHQVEVRVVSAGNIGHLVDERVVNALRPAFRWLVREHEGFEAWLRQHGAE